MDGLWTGCGPWCPSARSAPALRHLDELGPPHPFLHVGRVDQDAVSGGEVRPDADTEHNALGAGLAAIAAQIRPAHDQQPAEARRHAPADRGRPRTPGRPAPDTTGTQLEKHHCGSVAGRIAPGGPAPARHDPVRPDPARPCNVHVFPDGQARSAITRKRTDGCSGVSAEGGQSSRGSPLAPAAASGTAVPDISLGLWDLKVERSRPPHITVLDHLCIVEESPGGRQVGIVAAADDTGFWAAGRRVG